MKIVIVGFTVPAELMRIINVTDRVQIAQTYRFSWSLVAALKRANAGVVLMSVAPVSDYPGNPRIFWPLKRFEQDGAPGVLLPFVNLIVLKHLTRSLAAWTIGLRFVVRAGPEWILVHGVHTPFLWFAIGARRASGAKVVVVLTDPPGQVASTDGWLRRRLKAFDVFVTRSALKRCDAAVSLSRDLAGEYATDVPCLVMEGITDGTVLSTDPSRSKESATEFRVTYAGGLHEGYGVRELVDAVVASTMPNIRLQIFGKGLLSDWVDRVALHDPRVLPTRMVTPAQLLEIYQGSDCLIQPRDPAQEFVRYSFPSKLIEYMTVGVPVISTRLPTIPSDYHEHVFWSESGADGLQASIETLANWPAQRRREMGESARSFVLATRSPEAQGARVRDFLIRQSRGRVR